MQFLSCSLHGHFLTKCSYRNTLNARWGGRLEGGKSSLPSHFCLAKPSAAWHSFACAPSVDGCRPTLRICSDAVNPFDSGVLALGQGWMSAWEVCDQEDSGVGQGDWLWFIPGKVGEEALGLGLLLGADQ